MKHLSTAATVAVIAIAMLTVLCTGSAQAIEIDWPEPNWPGIFDSNVLLTLHLQMDPADWNTILHDTPDATDCLEEPIELPAWFWLEGEEDLKIKVSVRRKNGYAFPNETDPCKVALKIDINEYYGVDPCAATIWHGLKKLSLEANNHAIADVVSEGLACNLHHMASGPEGYGYDAWHANWVKLYVNGEYKGIYVNNEQRDKQLLRNRGIYVSHNSWFYKYANCEQGFYLRVGDDDFPKSPTLDALCYGPFVNEGNFPDLMPAGGICPTPNDVIVIADMNQWVNMQGLLTMNAVDAFIANSDCLFTHGQEVYFHDFNLLDPCETRKRMYFPWDNDSILKSTDWDIYYTKSGQIYDEVILGVPVFRSQYNQIMRDLLDGPFSFANINDFLNMVEPVLTPAIEADPWAMSEVTGKGYSTVAELFDGLRSWFSQRILNVLTQIEWDEPELPGIILLQDGFEGAVWDANWAGGHNWQADTGQYLHGSASAAAENGSEGTFTSADLDASDATAIHIDFKFRKKGIESPTDFTLSYYNGASYNPIADLETLGVDSEWLRYTDVTTDSQYFKSNFKIQFNASLSGGEDVWVDDVLITKLITAPVSPIISGYILDPKGAPIEGVLVSGDDGGGSDITDANGYYEFLVPYGWSNATQLWSCAATPTKADYMFDPLERTYSNVIVDPLNQDYVGTSIYDLNEDGYINFFDFAIFALAWRSSPGNANWNAVCDFYYDLTVNFKDFAKFGGGWKPE